MIHAASVLAVATEADVMVDLIVVLGASAFAVLGLARVGVSAIPALLLTGALIGPHGLALVPTPGALGIIGHLAIVFLLFGVGLELHLNALRPGALRLVLAGVVACLGCTAALWPLAAQVTSSAPAALVVAMALALSSTAMVLKYFTARRELTQVSGRLGLAILVVQDLAVIGMLALLPILARWAGSGPDDVQASDFGTTGDILLRLGAIGLIVVVGRKALPWILRESLRAGGTEALLLVGMAFALATAGACDALGFSLELGAFLAGFLLADTSFQQELSGQVMPVRDLFLAVFFTTLGMNADMAAVAAAWPAVLAGLAVLVLVKALVTSFACWAVGTHASTALVVGASLAHGGEFSLVLLDRAGASGLLGGDLHGVLVVIIVLGLILMPAVTALARRVAPRLHAAPLPPFSPKSLLIVPYGLGDDGESSEAPVLVAGYGPVGQRVAAAVDAAGFPLSVVELNPDTVSELRGAGIRAVLGDVQSEAVLRAGGIVRARALVLTIPDAAVARRTATLVRRLRPDVWIAARCPVVSARALLLEAGVDAVFVDEDSMGEHLADGVIAGLGAAEPQPADDAVPVPNQS